VYIWQCEISVHAAKLHIGSRLRLAQIVVHQVARIVGLKTFELNDTRQGRGKALARKTRLKAQPALSKPNERPNSVRVFWTCADWQQCSCCWAPTVETCPDFRIPNARTAIQRKCSCSRIEDWIFNILSWDIFRRAGCLIGLGMQG
jgi:hypothetical protein